MKFNLTPRDKAAMADTADAALVHKAFDTNVEVLIPIDRDVLKVSEDLT